MNPHSDFLSQQTWQPFESLFGIHNSILFLHSTTIANTWLALGILCLTTCIVRILLWYPHSMGGYLVRQIARSFIELVEQTAGRFIYKYYLFAGTLFLFIIGCNWIALIPGVKEATSDINTTVALGLITFGYLQKELVQKLGFFGWIKHYTLFSSPLFPILTVFPLNLIIGLCKLPLEILELFALVLSLSFRLFGNIFGGFMIGHIIKSFAAGSVLKQIFFVPINLVFIAFFVLFEGFLQAFVFCILALTNIVLKTEEGPEEHEEPTKASV